MKKVKKVKKLPGVRKKHPVRKRRLSGSGPDVGHELSKMKFK